MAGAAGRGGHPARAAPAQGGQGGVVMPTAVCESCGQVVYWRNVRGSSRPREHYACGGRLLMAANIKPPAEYADNSYTYRYGYLQALSHGPRRFKWFDWYSQDAIAAYNAGYDAALSRPIE